MLMEVLKLRGLKVLPFAYPDLPNVVRMEHALETLGDTLDTGIEKAEEVREELAGSRQLAQELDKLTWRGGMVSGWENHLWLVSASDFNGDPSEYQRQLGELVAEAKKRQPYSDDTLRLAYIGVPSVFAEDLYRYLERNGARVVFNEVQRQFAMPQPGECLAEQYCNYTYPYSVFDRLQDILPELRRRRVDGVIHYVQAFCHRGIADIIFREAIELPLLTLEGNADYLLTQHLQTRIEAFLDVLHRHRAAPRRKQRGGRRRVALL